MSFIYTWAYAPLKLISRHSAEMMYSLNVSATATSCHKSLRRGFSAVVPSRVSGAERHRQKYSVPLRSGNDQDPTLKNPEDGCTTLFPLPASFFEELARQPGVKVVIEQHSGDEDEEEWDEVMSELVDPWVQGPAHSSGMLELLAEETEPAMNSSGGGDVQEVATRAEVEELLKRQDGIRVVDVREAHEFEQGHLPSSLHVPVHALTGAVAREVAEGPVLVVGSADHRAQQAAVRLAKVYKAPQVWLYKGGVQEWQNAGGLLEQGKPIVQMS